MKNLNACLNCLKSLINHIIKICVLLILLSTIIFAQQDTLHKEQNQQQVQENSQDTIFVMHKSPLGAVLRSAILPGLGQIYNESYWKAPIIWGVGTLLIYNWIQYNNDFNYYRLKYIQTGDENYRTLRSFYQDQRDLMSIYMGIVYLLNLVDAYVDAQLFDFTVSPNTLTNLPMLNVRLHF
jgi:Family of unknown function (DUF5683)